MKPEILKKHSDARAKLTRDDDEFLLMLIKDNDDDGKVIFKDSRVIDYLEKLSKKLDFDNIENMLDTAANGDLSEINLGNTIEDKELPDLDIILNILNKYIEQVNEDMPYEIMSEIRKNYISDLTAAIVENAYEKLVYEIFVNMNELVIKEIQLVSSEICPISSK